MHRSPRNFPYLAGATPRVLAHRGLHTGAAENSRSAFAAALDTGTRIIETDVHGSSDGVAIICHDPDLSRIAEQPHKVAQLSAASLNTVHISPTDTLLTLEQALTAFPNAHFNIDVKDDLAIAGTVAAITATAAHDRVLITSFSRGRRRKTAAQLPGIASSPSAVEFFLMWLAAVVGVPVSGHHFVAVQIPEKVGILKIVSPRIIRAFHSAGLEIHVWTVNDPGDMQRLLALGVDGIVTDRCDIAQAIITSG
ncbi:MAG: glycerophosphodiester phosphodiesterase family protein [Microbacteriaceae bacterium]